MIYEKGDLKKNHSWQVKIFGLEKMSTDFTPIGKIAENTARRSVFLTIFHCILNTDTNSLLRSYFLAFWPTGSGRVILF